MAQALIFGGYIVTTRGITMADLSPAQLVEILERHRGELQQIAGYAGSGVNKDGIVISVEKEHGKFPTELEGAKVNIEPALRGWDIMGMPDK